MDVLIVGAGAVGQVYGHHLQAGGARLGYFVKPKHADAARRGFALYPLNRRNPRAEPVRFAGFDVMTEPSEVARRHWDQVWLAIPSPALTGTGIEPLIAATGAATILVLQPGLRDVELLRSICSPERLIEGVIVMISYQAPLPGENVPEPGVAYWFPPFSATPLSGPRERVAPVVRLLRAGGCPAKAVPNASRRAAALSAMLMPLLAGLEAEDWSLAALRRSPRLDQGIRATRQAMAVAAAFHDRPAPWASHLVTPLLMRLVSRAAPRLVPLDLESYLRYHFTKVGDQTRLMLSTYVDEGNRRGYPVDAITELTRALPQAAPGK